MLFAVEFYSLIITELSVLSAKYSGRQNNYTIDYQRFPLHLTNAGNS